MISSIVLTGKHKINMNSAKKIKVGDNILSVEKDIPFVRYRFDSYDESALAYIKSIMEQFNISTHLVEIPLNENVVVALQLISSQFSNVAKYVYIELTEAEVQARQLDQNKLALIGATLSFGIDRYMLKDKSVSLDTITARAIIKSLVTCFRIAESNVGVCSSPLSFSDWACLTAVKARELMSVYSPIADVPLPSANHQCMNCCGCIRYMVVSEDLQAPTESKSSKSQKKGSKSSDNKDENTKTTASKSKPKNVIVPGIYNL